MSRPTTSCIRAESVQNFSLPKVSSRKPSRPCRSRSLFGFTSGNCRQAANNATNANVSQRTIEASNGIWRSCKGNPKGQIAKNALLQQDQHLVREGVRELG